MITLSNPETAAAFDALTEFDQEIEVPVVKKDCNCKSYKGLLSNITPCAAKRYVEFGGNLIAQKQPPADIEDKKVEPGAEIKNKKVNYGNNK